MEVLAIHGNSFQPWMGDIHGENATVAAGEGAIKQ